MKPDYTLLDQTAQALGCPLRADEPMARHTTFQIGGPADRFLIVENAAQLQGLLSCLRQAGIPYLVLGKGSNLLVSDKGIRGAVLHLGGDFKKVEVLTDGRTLRAGAGAPLASVCALARERSLTGLEFAWGIPGSVGGGAYMDAGAYGGEMRDVVSRVLHLGPDGRPRGGQGGGALLRLPEEPLHRRGGHHHRRGIHPAARGPGGHRREDGGADGPAERQAALRHAQRRERLQAAPERLCRRPHRAVRPERPPGGGRAGQREARGLYCKHRGATCQDVLGLIAVIQKTVEEQTGTCLECEVRVTGEE